MFEIPDLRRRETLHLRSVCRGEGEGVALICSYIPRLRLFFEVLNFNIYFFFRKLNILGVMKILWIFFGG